MILGLNLLISKFVSKHCKFVSKKCEFVFKNSKFASNQPQQNRGGFKICKFALKKTSLHSYNDNKYNIKISIFRMINNSLLIVKVEIRVLLGVESIYRLKGRDNKFLDQIVFNDFWNSIFSPPTLLPILNFKFKSDLLNLVISWECHYNIKIKVIIWHLSTCHAIRSPISPNRQCLGGSGKNLNFGMINNSLLIVKVEIRVINSNAALAVMVGEWYISGCFYTSRLPSSQTNSYKLRGGLLNQ